MSSILRAARLPSFALGVFLVVCTLATQGCRTVNAVMVDYRKNIAAGNYSAAAAEPAKLVQENDGDRLLWWLMAASAYDLAGETDQAILSYDVADDIFVENGARSVFSQATSDAYAMMLNDKYFPYDGGGQDRIFTCFYKAVAYGAKGDIGGARLEFNRADQYEDNWLDERKKDLAAADERLEKEAAAYAKDKGGEGSDNAGQSKIAVQNAMKDDSFAATVKEAFGFDIFSSGILDKLKPADYKNPYVVHANGIFRWLAGDGDGAGYLNDVHGLRPENSVVSTDLKMCSSGTKPDGLVWIYAEDGLGPRREEWRIDLPLVLIPYAGKYVKYAGLCLPRLKAEDPAASAWSAGGEQMQTLANVDALVKIEYDVYMRGALKREITRTIVDVGVQVALGVVAENVSDWRTQTALIASQYAVAAYSYVRRGADTRSWPALPKTVYVVRVRRPPDGVVHVAADGQNVAEVKVPEGNSMVFVRKPGPLAAASVKVINFPRGQ